MARLTLPRFLLTGCAVLGALAISPGAMSEDTSGDSDKLAEIVVTAQKREQNLQDVGTSVTAFDTNTLERLGLRDVTEIAGQVPGLQYNQFGATVTIYNLRGVSQNDFSDHQEAPIAVYADDAYIASTGALAGSLFDLQRVEVLRGPQGTLFGRNATGGLIQYISNQPTDHLDGYLDLTGGNFGRIDSEGAIGGPLTDTLSGRASFATNYHDGYITNRIGPSIANEKQYAGRIQLTFKPADNTEFRLKVHGVTNDRETAGNYSWASAQPDATGRGVFTPGQPDDFGYTNPSTDPFNQAEDRRGLFNRTVFGTTLHGIWKTDLFTLTSVTDYLHVMKRYGEDSDVSPNPIFNYDVLYHYHQLSQELRLNGALEGFRWVGGLYYLDYHSRDIGTTDLIQPIGFGKADFSLSTSSPSLFAQTEYDFTRQLTLITGARYTYDDKKFYYNYVCVNCPQSLTYNPGTYPGAARTFNIGTGKVELDYKPVEDVLAYASWNRGAKGGGWSAPTAGPVDPLTLPYNMERLTSIELGFKSTFWDGRARLNGSIFHYDYKNYQGFFLDVATQVVENVDAHVKGGELEFAVVPVHGLNLQLGVSHLESLVPHVPTPAGDIVPAEMPQAPHWSFNAVARYEWPLLGGIASVETDAKWNSRQYLELINAPVDLQSSYALINGRAGFGTSDNRWQVDAFIKNAANKFYRMYNLDLSGFIGVNQGVYGPPREYGLEIRYHIGGG
ncbi:MAG TPA: TonB-dependent receptor [Steroidobacteraceae bacterium]|nr:TonB-dependent receptor [Steroidobacteraceae bacterium]